MLTRRQMLWTIPAGMIQVAASVADDRSQIIRDVKTIAVLPSNSSNLQSLHEQARGYAAEQLPENEPFEIKSFVPYLTKGDELDSGKRRPNTSSRRHAFSVGLEMLTDDKKRLPMASGDLILGYLKAHFVSIQARIYREPVSRALYLGARCFALTSSFRGSNLSEAFVPTVADSVNNIRSLGLFLPPRTASTPANLRTLVLVHKNQVSETKERITLPKTNYEYVFIRAHDLGADRLQLHCFATSDDRTKFHWLRLGERPALPADCSIVGAVHFTEYSMQGMYPKSAVIRRSLIVGQKSFEWESLDSFSRKSSGHALSENLTQVLDAIIRGEVRETDSLRALGDSRDPIGKPGKR